MGFIAAGLYYVINIFNDWPIFRGKFLGTEQPYLDLYQTIAQVDCVANRIKELGFSEACNECGYVYSRFLYELILITRLENDYVFLLGSLLNFSLLILLFYVLWRVDWCQPAIQYMSFSLLLICSPPMMLLMERNNLDIVVACLLLLAVRTFPISNKAPVAFLLIIATLIKFYAYAAFLLLPVFLHGRQRAKYILSAMALIPLIIIDLNSVKSNLPYPTEAAFGVSLAGKYLVQGETTRVVDFVIGVSLVFISLLLMLKIDAKFSLIPTCVRIQEPTYRANRFGFLVFSSVFLANYFITSSYDYRLVFLIVAGWFFASLVVFSSRQKYFWMALMLISFWFSFNMGILQVVGDIGLGLLVSLLIIFLYRLEVAKRHI